jgi:hypothetical protein
LKVLRRVGSFVANLLTAVIGTVAIDSELYGPLRPVFRKLSWQDLTVAEDILSAVCAFALGLLVFYKWRSRSAKWVWIAGTLVWTKGAFDPL